MLILSLSSVPPGAAGSMASSSSCLWPSAGRRDLIGRRFFAIRCDCQRSVLRGLIRASTHAECSAAEAKVLVECDDAFHSKARNWVSVCNEFDAFLVEDTLVGIAEDSLSQGDYKLALEFMIIVNKTNQPNQLCNIEYLLPDRPVRYIPISRIVRLKEEDYVKLIDGRIDYACRTTFTQWLQFQQSQQILINYPLHAVGHFVKVYNTEGSDQWYNGRITGFNENTKIFTIVDEHDFEHNENCMLVQMELSSKDSTSILRDVTTCTGSKPRSRLSLEEHEVCKQPKLDLPDGESIRVSASANVQRVVPLSVAGTSQGTKLVSVGSGSRNIFQVVLDAKESVSHTSSVSLNYQLAAGHGSIIQTTAQKPNVLVTPSTVRHLEPTKIKNLLGYRPPSVMLMRPTPCVITSGVATSGVATSCTTTCIQNASQTSRLSMASPICSDHSRVKELLEHKKSVSQVDVRSRQPHSNTSWNCEYLGSMLVSLGRTGSNLTNVGGNQQPKVSSGVSSIGNQQIFDSTQIQQQNDVPEFSEGQRSDEVQGPSEAKLLRLSKTESASETVTTSHQRREQGKVQQLPNDLAGMLHSRGGDHVGPTQIGITTVSAKPRTLVRKCNDFQNQSQCASVVHGSELADLRIKQHLQSFTVGKGKQQLPLIASAGNVSLTSDGEGQSHYSVAGCQRPRMFLATSPQVNLNQVRLNCSRISEACCMQQLRCRLTRPQGGEGKLRKSSRQMVQEVVKSVLHQFGSSAGFVPHKFQEEHGKGNCSTSQLVVQQEHGESYTSKNDNLNSCEETQENSPTSVVSSFPSDTVANLDESAVNSCRNMGNARKLQSNILAPLYLRSVDARNSGTSSAMVNTLSYGPLQQQTGKRCGLQAQKRRSNSQSYFYKARVDLDNSKVVTSREGAVSVPRVQPPGQTVSESLDHLPPQEVTLTMPGRRNLKANTASRNNKHSEPLKQFGQSAKKETGGNLKVMPSRSKVNSTGRGKNNVWFEEYENELLDLSRVLDLMKRLDNGPCVRGLDSSTSSLAETFQRSKQPLSNQTNKPSTLDAFRHSTHHHSIVASLKKSDCETKMDNFQQQILSLGLKFGNPSAVLSKKKLNVRNMSSDEMKMYIQDKSCLELNFSALLRCRECKSAYSSTTKLSQVLCRFHAFRRLTHNAKGHIVSGGFLSPTDADSIDLSLWMPMLPIVDPQIDIAMAKYIIKNVGNRFCELVEQEKEAMSWVSSNNEIAWKQAVNGIREMCDVCSTTLFNIHWVCRKCGYVACLDCYRTMTRRCSRCRGSIVKNCKACSVGHVKWAKCSIDRQPHEPREMMVTQIIPSDVLWFIGRVIHNIRKKWNIFENCPCGENRDINLLDDSSSLEQVTHVTQSDEPVSSTDDHPLSSGLEPSSPDDEPITGVSSDACHDVSVVGLATQNQPVDSSCDKTVECKSVANQSLPPLRDFILHNDFEFDGIKDDNLPATNGKSLNDVLRRVIDDIPSKPAPKGLNFKLSPGCRSPTASGASSGPVNLDLPSADNIPHVWLDSGRLLQLLEPRHPGNLKMFQEVWQKGKPVMISNCDKHITKELWLPEAFAKEFGDMENDLVDCTHKVVLIGHKMQRFWQGFEKVSARLKDSQNEPMILKLKDWPPMEDFSEMLPTRFEDLLQGLPLPEYTHRTGVFNIASRLPDYFVRPDLGPKMYNAYGSALHPMVGSTNLHLDISDAVNLILYVGIPMDDTEDHEAAAIEGMKTAGCCEPTMARITHEGHKPGALWHIFDAKDSDKIRDLLTKVGLEIGEPVEPNHDPIHDQSWYLDEALRERLLREYSVQGYTLVQCVGDAIFIPAGAPHQVRNFHSCIKAAEDFVSPENLSHCFQLTQEFRQLSDTHSNHEDKLQVKNIIYHAVKDAIAVLQNTEPDSI